MSKYLNSKLYYQLFINQLLKVYNLERGSVYFNDGRRKMKGNGLKMISGKINLSRINEASRMRLNRNRS